MGLFARIFQRPAPVDVEWVGQEQRFHTSTWSVTLPADWALRRVEKQALYFESADRQKGLYVTQCQIDTKQAPLRDITRRLHEASRAGLFALHEFEWSLQRDEVIAYDRESTALLDAHDAERCYRLCTQTQVKPPYALRVAYHDAICQNYILGRTRAAQLLASVQITA